MKDIACDLKIRLSKVNPVDVRLVLFVLTLVLFVLGAGAPDAGGGFVH